MNIKKEALWTMVLLALPLSGFAESLPARGEKIGVVENVYYIKEDRVNGMNGTSMISPGGNLGNTIGGGVGAVVGMVAGFFGGNALGKALEPKTNLEIHVNLDDGSKLTVTQLQEAGDGFTPGDRVRVLSDASGTLHVSH